jgi:hypothetical protein
VRHDFESSRMDGHESLETIKLDFEARKSIERTFTTSKVSA